MSGTLREGAYGELASALHGSFPANHPGRSLSGMHYELAGHHVRYRYRDRAHTGTVLAHYPDDRSYGVRLLIHGDRDGEIRDVRGDRVVAVHQRSNRDRVEALMSAHGHRRPHERPNSEQRLIRRAVLHVGRPLREAQWSHLDGADGAYHTVICLGCGKSGHLEAPIQQAGGWHHFRCVSCGHTTSIRNGAGEDVRKGASRDHNNQRGRRPPLREALAVEMAALGAAEQFLQRAAR